MHKGYPIIIEKENPQPNEFLGLRDNYRAIQLLKNRFGKSDKIVPVNFFGEIGYWRQLPKAEEIQDYKPYLSLNFKQEDTKDITTPVVENKKQITFSF